MTSKFFLCFLQFLTPLLVFPFVSLDSTFATKGYIASASTQCLWVCLCIVCWVYLCTGIIPCFTSRPRGEMFGSHEFSLCACVSKSHLDCLALRHLLPLTGLSASPLGLWFHFSLRETNGCGSGWLFSTLPSSINLALESKGKMRARPQIQVFQGEPASSLCRGYLFAWHAHKEINVTCRSAEAGR